jgi:hypothetical protein
MDIIPLLATLVSAAILLSVIELIRRNRLKEKYSLLWLFSTLVMLWFSFSRESLHVVSRMIGIKYPPSFIFLLGFLFMIVINIHITSVISELYDKNKTLAQEIALLKKALADRKDNGE